MSQGQPHVAAIMRTGTGAAINFNFGFVPHAVTLNNTTGNCIGYWNDLMPDASMQKIVDSGAGATDISFVTAQGVTPYSGANGGEALTGTFFLVAGTRNITGASSKFASELEVGDLIKIGPDELRVDSVASDTVATVAEPASTTSTNVKGYRLTRSGGGITLGTDVDLNVNNEVLYVTAWR